MKLQRTLKRGLEGPDVELLQKELLVVGFPSDKEEQTRRQFGPGTEAAVHAFQLVHAAGLRALAWKGEEGVVEAVTAIVLTREVETAAAENARDPEFLVRGSVEGLDGRPLARAVVTVSDQDVLGQQSLGVAITDESGSFSLPLEIAKFQAAEVRTAVKRGAADLVFEVADERKRQRTVTALSVTLPGGGARAIPRIAPWPDAPFVVMNAEAHTTVRLRVAEAEGAALSELEEVEARLAPGMRGTYYADLKEGDGSYQISFLAAETDVARGTIERLRASDQASRKTTERRRPVPLAAFYGLASAGLPVDLAALGNQPRHRLEAALRQAISQRVIPGDLSPRVPGMVDDILAVAADEAMEAGTDGGGGILHAWLALARIPEAQRTGFLRTTADHEGTDKELWQKLEKEGYLGEGEGLQRAKLVFQLGNLSRDHLPLVQALIEDEHLGIRRARDVARLEEKTWFDLLEREKIDLPDNLPAGNLDKAAQRRRYAAGLARVSRRAFPTAAVEGLAARSHAALRLHPQLSPWLRAAELAAEAGTVPEFDLRNVHIDRFLAEHGPRIDPRAPAQLADDLKRLQRTLLVAVDPIRIEPLLRAGLDSALKIANIPPSIFLAEHGAALGEKAAAEIHGQATSIHLGHLFLHTTLLDHFSSPQPYLMTSASDSTVA